MFISLYNIIFVAVLVIILIVVVNIIKSMLNQCTTMLVLYITVSENRNSLVSVNFRIFQRIRMQPIQVTQPTLSEEDKVDRFSRLCYLFISLKAACDMTEHRCS